LVSFCFFLSSFSGGDGDGVDRFGRSGGEELAELAAAAAKARVGENMTGTTAFVGSATRCANAARDDDRTPAVEVHRR
jgi:hypothetical protein